MASFGTNVGGLFTTLWRKAGQPLATISRGSSSTTDVKIIPGFTETVEGFGGVSVETARQAAFYIRRADYQIDGSVTNPRKRDRLSWTDDAGNTRNYEVLPDASREVNPVDQMGLLIKVDVKETAAA